MQRFLSIAAGELRYGPALARVIAVFGGDGDPERCRAIAERAFTFLETHLADRPGSAADQPTIADLACYRLLRGCAGGRCSLSDYPGIRAWLARVEALPGFKAMPAGVRRKSA